MKHKIIQPRIPDLPPPATSVPAETPPAPTMPDPTPALLGRIACRAGILETPDQPIPRTLAERITRLLCSDAASDHASREHAYAQYLEKIAQFARTFHTNVHDIAALYYRAECIGWETIIEGHYGPEVTPV